MNLLHSPKVERLTLAKLVWVASASAEAYAANNPIHQTSKLPGLAWLEFKVSETPEGKSLVTQRALYHPRGLFGHIYWWMVFPMHGIVFPSMATKMAGSSAKKFVEH